MADCVPAHGDKCKRLASSLFNETKYVVQTLNNLGQGRNNIAIQKVNTSPSFQEFWAWADRRTFLRYHCQKMFTDHRSRYSSVVAMA